MVALSVFLMIIVSTMVSAYSKMVTVLIANVMLVTQVISVK